ncbi:MAG: hypothetical protein RLZZ292_1876 [Bacteroidota bacterium]|jgi:hypothetical protein
MRKSNFLVALVTLVLFSFAACKKDPPTVTELLTGHAWKILDKKKNGTAITVDDCDTDDVYTYVTGGNLTINYGTKKCMSSEPAALNGNWQLINGDTGIKTTYSIGTLSGEITYTIDELTATKLVVTYTALEGIGKTATYQVTFDTYKK